MRHAWLLPPAVAAVALVACGGSSSTSIADPASNDGGSTTTDGGGAAGPTYTLDNVCELTAPKICALRRSCCEGTFGYDEAACIANAKADCAQDVAEARGGRMTFHPELVEPCFAKFQPILDACFETVDVLYRAFDIADCRMFVGQLDEGAQCERDSQCKSGPAGSFVDCNDDRGTCTYTRLFAEGEPCRYGDSSGGLCAKGLYCDAPLGGSPGTCKKATPIGTACDAQKTISPECGLGAYCDKGTGKCAAAKEEGAPCDTALDCKSLRCDSGGSGGRRCQKASPIVDASECK